MAPEREITVTSKKPLPQGYAFLPKGDRYKTLHCRRLTHEAGKPLYIVEDAKTKKTLGIRVPKFVFFQVQTQARETLDSRRTATQKRDAALSREAAAELKAQYPSMPESEQKKILKHAFRKYSRRVGRTAQIPMSEKVKRAVGAHVRHKYTKYDTLMNGGMDKKEARKKIAKAAQNVLREWGADGGTPECIVISSDEEIITISSDEELSDCDWD